MRTITCYRPMYLKKIQFYCPYGTFLIVNVLYVLKFLNKFKVTSKYTLINFKIVKVFIEVVIFFKILIKHLNYRQSQISKTRIWQFLVVILSYVHFKLCIFFSGNLLHDNKNQKQLQTQFFPFPAYSNNVV